MKDVHLGKDRASSYAVLSLLYVKIQEVLWFHLGIPSGCRASSVDMDSFDGTISAYVSF